jgi:hypothetical protein
MHDSVPDMASLEPAPRAQVENILRLPELVNGNEPLVRRGRFVDLEFQLVVDDFPCFVTIAHGRVTKVHSGPLKMHSSAFVVRTSATHWEKFWQRYPEPWWHDLFAMVKKGYATIDGDLHAFMCNLQYFKDVIASPRHAHA